MQGPLRGSEGWSKGGNGPPRESLLGVSQNTMQGWEQGLTGRVFQLRVGSGSGIGKNYRVGSGLGLGSGIGIIY